MRIGEPARRAGVSTRALRYYEQRGLIRSRRSANGYREYDESDVRIVAEIRALGEVVRQIVGAKPKRLLLADLAGHFWPRLHRCIMGRLYKR